MVDTPFVSPNDGGDPTANLPSPDEFSKLQDQWNSFLDKPEGRAALLSFGINMLQPPGFGQNFAGQFGQSIGAAGQTVGNIEKMNIAEAEAASKEEQRKAAADLATARTGQVGLAAQLGLERLQQGMTIAQLAQSNKLHGDYLAHVAKIQKGNDDIRKDLLLSPDEKLKQMRGVPTFEEWLASDPAAADIAARAGIRVSPAAPAPATPAAVPDAPPNPRDRKAGTKYDTPKGPMTWTGTGWVP